MTMTQDERDQLVGLLARAVEALERQADAMERALEPADDPQALDPQLPDKELLPGAGKPLREDGWTPVEEELAAAIEELEDEGVLVPASSYKALGLDPPRREDEPDAPPADEPTADPAEPPEPEEPAANE